MIINISVLGHYAYYEKQLHGVEFFSYYIDRLNRFFISYHLKVAWNVLKDYNL